MTNLASAPIWSEAAAAALVGSNLAAAAIAAAETAMQGDIDPAQDNRGPNDFKRHVAKLHVKLTVNGKPVEALVDPWLLLFPCARNSASPARISAARPRIAAPARST